MKKILLITLLLSFNCYAVTNYSLEIKKADGKRYCLNHFRSNKERVEWLAEEKTRPYWKKEYTYHTQDILDPIKPEPTTKELRKKELRDIARGENGKTKRPLNIQELNEYLF